MHEVYECWGVIVNIKSELFLVLKFLFFFYILPEIVSVVILGNVQTEYNLFYLNFWRKLSQKHV